MHLDSWESTLVAKDARGASYATFMLSQLSACILVQSLNSPFFPSHTGAEPGRAKEESRVESRITCMRMLRTNQSKITGPNHAARVNVSRNAFFSSRSERKHFLWRWYCRKNIKTLKSKYGSSWSVPLSTTSTRRYSFAKHCFRIVFVCWAILQKFLNGKCDAYK